MSYRDDYTPADLRRIAARFARLAARLDGMADAIDSASVPTVSLKLGTATGTLFDRITASLDQAEFDVIKAVRIAMDQQESAIIGGRIADAAEQIRKKKG